MENPAWMLMLRGTLAVVFGLAAVLVPGLTLLLLVGMFAAYALLSGVSSIALAVKSRRVDRKWWLLLLLGLVSVAAAVLAVVYPGMTALVLVLVMGINAVVTGALDVAIAVHLRRILRSHWMMVASGMLSILFGALVIAMPQAGALALVWLISLHAIVTGVLLLGLGLRVRRAARGDASRKPVPFGVR
jgi:uncharacterized membrane protein HdeD (DUF308 family)